MDYLTPQQRVIMIKIFDLNKSCIVNTQKNGLKMCHSTTQRVIKNFKTQYALQDSSKPGKAHTARRPQNIDVVRESIDNSLRNADIVHKKLAFRRYRYEKFKREHFHRARIQIVQQQENNHKCHREWRAKMLQLNIDELKFNHFDSLTSTITVIGNWKIQD